MYKQLNLVPIYNIIFYVWCSWGCGVCVGRGRLGVCGSAVVPPLWRLGGFGAVMFGNTAELGGQGFPWGNSVWWNLHHDNWKIIFYFITPRYFDQFYEHYLWGHWYLCVYINVNYVCSIDHYTIGGSHASDIITCLNGSLLGITNHI